MKVRGIRLIARIQLILLLMMSLIGGSVSTVKCAENKVNSKVIKVGFFKFAGYHDVDQYGNKSGYGYDFIQMISRYDNDDYKFVGYRRGWKDMMNMLDRGDIDILTNVAKTPEREKKYLYSQKTIGNDGSIFTVRDDNSTVVAGDYKTYDGIVIGSIKDSVQVNEFKEFAKKKGFSYTVKNYGTEEEMEQALDDKKVDGIVSIGLRNLQNEKVIEQINKSDMYVICRKTDQALMKQINQAIDRLDQESSNWRSELFDKYYQADQGNNISFLSDEIDYIKQWKKDKKVLQVAVNPDRKPYSYYEDGKMKGIIPRIFKKAADRIGIDYKFKVVRTREEYQKLIKSGEIDACLDEAQTASEASDAGYKVTKPYLTASVARVERRDFSGTIKTVAMLKDADINKSDEQKLVQGVKTREYETTGECIQAVKDKTVDAAYVYSYTAQTALNEDPGNHIKMNIMMDFDTQFTIAVPKTKDYRLLSILNKGMSSVEDSYIQNVVTDETDYEVSSVPVLDYLRQNPIIIAGIVIIFILVVIAIVLLLMRIRTSDTMKEEEEKKNKILEEKAEQEAELVQAMTYVCKTNELVRNTNLVDRTITDYYLKDGKLETKTAPYIGFDIANHNNTFHPDDYQQIVGRFDETKVQYLSQHGGGEEYFECRSKDETGAYRWYGYTMQAVPADVAHPCNYIVYKKDIQEAKAREIKDRENLEKALVAAQEASAAKGQFMSRMSHEIRTPLNAVIGYMTIAQMDDADREKVQHCLENSELAAKHLLSIINDVLDMSAIESGRIKIANVDYNLKQQLSTIATIFYNQAKNRDIDFKVHMKKLTQEWVVGDQLRVNQILMNLLSNAIKFTPGNGSVSLWVTQQEMTDEEVKIEFKIQDSGIGMSKEYLSRIFTPFEQENAQTSQKYGGTGLGLAISKNLCDLMHGRILVESEQGEGTTFTITLSFGVSAQNSKVGVTKKEFKRLRVLVVDDQKDEQTYIKEILKRIGVKADCVSDGKSAIRRFVGRQNTDYAYDLCIIDWKMPDENGIEVARKMKEVSEKNIPILIATAYDITEIEQEAKQVGIDHVIAKPLFQSTLFDLLVDTYGTYEVKGEQKAASFDLQGARVLLAEDNEMNTEIAVSILEKAGVIVDTAENGQVAVDTFLSKDKGYYTAILMDIQMPVMDGYEATKVIRTSNHPQARDIPIIALTANAFTEDVEKAHENGMNAHIAKPVDYEKLYHTLSDCMNRE